MPIGEFALFLRWQLTHCLGRCYPVKREKSHWASDSNIYLPSYVDWHKMILAFKRLVGLSFKSFHLEDKAHSVSTSYISVSRKTSVSLESMHSTTLGLFQYEVDQRDPTMQEPAPCNGHTSTRQRVVRRLQHVVQRTPGPRWCQCLYDAIYLFRYSITCQLAEHSTTPMA